MRNPKGTLVSNIMLTKYYEPMYTKSDKEEFLDSYLKGQSMKMLNIIQFILYIVFNNSLDLSKPSIFLLANFDNRNAHATA